jgi:Family of unknown function (DUF6169)
MESYKFKVHENEFNSHSFTTENKIVYEVKFKPTGDIFKYRSIWTYYCYEFCIEVIENPTSRLPPPDAKIPPTIANIFLDFFQDKEKSVLYTCETKDGKAPARLRKFDAWFRQFNSDIFLKIDNTTYDPALGVTYYNSLIIKQINPYKDEIVQAFKSLFEGFEDEK